MLFISILGSGAMVGWNDPGHPYKLYEYYAELYFDVQVTEMDTEGNTLTPPTHYMVKAGENFTIPMGTHEGYTLKEIWNGDQAACISHNTAIVVLYERVIPDGIEGVESGRAKQAIYDLSGRRVNRLSHQGIYIIDGQKVYVK